MIEGDTPADDNTPPRSSFIAVLGAPNAGKSTLVNRIVGTKVTIVSPKVQTTRTRVRGIAIVGPVQLVFIDTPGIFNPKRRLERAMVAAAWDGAADADEVVLLVDAGRGLDDDTGRIVAGLKKSGRSAILALNKIDVIRREKLLELAAQFSAHDIFKQIFMISAQTGDGVDDLVTLLADKAPVGPWMFPEDEISDMPMRLLAAEITREKVFLQLQQELPYSITVVTDQWQERDDGSARIDQTIVVQRENQRAIVLGKGGSRIKSLGQAARTEMEYLFERRIHLFLHVKVIEDWLERRTVYNEWSLKFDA
ncbi:MAG: GTPase Era [Alphaproteobacteria bacterium]|nr:GTPase Era [Alphaproteobacteria bacterium]